MRILVGLLAIPLLLTSVALPAAAQDRPWSLPDDPTLLEGWLAWDRGEYPTALEHYMQALQANPAHAAEIAALTGEVWTTTEIAPDGGDMQVAPDGRYMSFIVEEGGADVTKVVEVATGEVVATLASDRVALGPDGQVAWLTMDGPAIAAAREADANASGRQERVDARRALQLAQARYGMVRVRSLAGGEDRFVDVPGYKVDMAWVADRLVIVGADEQGAGFLFDASRNEQVSASAPSYFQSIRAVGRTAIVEVGSEPAIPVEGAPEGRFPGIRLAEVSAGELRLDRFYEGSSLSVSEDGSTVAFLRETRQGEPGIQIIRGTGDAVSSTLYTPPENFSSPVVSPDGEWVAFQMIDIHDWEIWALPTDGSAEEPIRITDHIHHDRRPQWVGDRILVVRGEGRHQRSYLFPVEQVGEPTKLFHNNTIRTIAPEYEWVATPDASAVFIVAERDGDTVSPERAVHKVDLTRPATAADVEQRLRAMMGAETSLRQRGSESFRVKADEIRQVTEEIETERVYAYAADLYRFGSKNIRADGGGNRRAIEYLVETLEGWGYEPILDWWSIPPDIETTNVVVRLEGTANPELVYVISSHFDSSTRGPGADDNSSGTTALLEVARVLANRPQEATIELAFFTGEESGLLGSRRYVAKAQESGKRIVGALNNDMVGWAGDHRLDNTIRYSNPGIRDIQHAAAMMFSKLITYDALYYKSTDAAAYYEAYGDIVGGIGSYPVLSNPHYHRYTDRLETINHELVAEVGRTTAATIMLLASTPSRLNDLTATRAGSEIQLRWSAAPEYDVVGYEVAWTDDAGQPQVRRVEAGSAGSMTARIPGVADGTTVAVRAIDADGQRGWDAARVVVGG